MQSTLRSFDLAHLAHVELLTPKPDESLRFFVDVMGMTESGRRGQSVYLRGWDDYEHHTLKLTEAKVAGMGHFAYRATSPEALQRRVAAIESAGLGKGWTEGDLGHGRAYAFTTPEGHNMEVYYETEWYKPPPDLKPALKNQAQRFPARGVNVRRLDHMNLLTSDVAGLRHFLEGVLGLRTTEMIVLDSGIEAGAWVTCNNKSYDLAFTLDHYGAHGRFHHVTYAFEFPRGDSPRCRYLPRGRGAHRDRAAQARYPADFFPLRLRAGRQSRGGGQCGRAPGAGTRLAAGGMDGDRAQEGAGVGLENDRELPHPRHPADRAVSRTAQRVRFPLPMLLQHGERARVRGGHKCRRNLFLPLTPTLSPQAGRGRQRRPS